MKDRQLFFLCILLSAALLLLLFVPYPPDGGRVCDLIFHGRWTDKQEPNHIQDQNISPDNTEDAASPAGLQRYYTVTTDELPGRYELISVRNEENEFPDELLAELRQLGIPMALELHTDGSGILGIFDQGILFTYSCDSLMISVAGKTLPFYYSDGILRVQDGDRCLVFRK